jgi:hypothetical protein
MQSMSPRRLIPFTFVITHFMRMRRNTLCGPLKSLMRTFVISAFSAVIAHAELGEQYNSFVARMGKPSREQINPTTPAFVAATWMEMGRWTTVTAWDGRVASQTHYNLTAEQAEEMMRNQRIVLQNGETCGFAIENRTENCTIWSAARNEKGYYRAVFRVTEDSRFRSQWTDLSIQWVSARHAAEIEHRIRQTPSTRSPGW